MNRVSSIKNALLPIVFLLLTLARSATADTPAAPASAAPAPASAAPAPASAAPAPASAAPAPASAAPALTSAAPAPASAAPVPLAVPVVVFHRTIAVLRAPLLGIAPPERARHSQVRLEEIFSRPGPMKVSVTSTPVATAILVDGALALALTSGDVDVLEGETLEHATQAAREAIERVAAETREARDRERLAHALAASGIATLLLLVLFALVLRTRAWLVRQLSKLLEGSTHGLTAAGVPVFHRARLFGVSRLLVRGAAAFVLTLATYRWSSFVLNQFPYTRAWGEQLDGYLLGVVSRIGGGVLRALPDLLVALLIFLLARGVLAVARPVFEGVEKRSSGGGWLDADTAKPTRRIFAMLVWAFATVMAYPYLPGASSDAFKGVSVLIGLMVTLGGSSLFGQAASGFILLYSRTLRIGEFVRIGEQEGTVIELGVFTTKISTGLGEQLTLPNALVLGTVTRNYSRPTNGHGFMLRTKVTIGYDAPWRQVQALLIEAARRTPGVATQPAPQVFQTALSDFYVEYEVVCQASQANAKSRAEAIAALNANVIDAFNEYGVQMMSPHYLADPAQTKVVPRSAWHAAPAKPEKPTDDESAQG